MHVVAFIFILKKDNSQFDVNIEKKDSRIYKKTLNVFHLFAYKYKYKTTVF